MSYLLGLQVEEQSSLFLLLTFAFRAGAGPEGREGRLGGVTAGGRRRRRGRSGSFFTDTAKERGVEVWGGEQRRLEQYTHSASTTTAVRCPLASTVAVILALESSMARTVSSLAPPEDLPARAAAATRRISRTV